MRLPKKPQKPRRSKIKSGLKIPDQVQVLNNAKGVLP
jgi:hypothetical protein